MRARSQATPRLELRAAVADAARERRRRRVRRRALQPRAAAASPSSATTRPTRRCCWRPRSATPPREVAEQLAEELGERLGDDRRAARGRRARASSTSSSPTPGTAERRAVPSAQGDGRPIAACRRARDGQRRVRVGQPDRAADGGRRAPRRLRRLGRPAARVRRPPGRARVLRQRPRRPDRAFAESIAARMRGRDRPEDGYEGDYVAELAERLARGGHRPRRPRRAGAARRRADGRADRRRRCARYGVEFDTWSSERALHESGAVERALERAARRRATSTRARARPGCARPTSATTRTAC